MSSTPKVSVYVPIYNVAPFIERCARSLFEQTLEDLEYIFVDDKSPDDSVDILLRVLDEYPHRKSQVRLIRHTKNQGISGARTTAYRAVTGEFVIGCDSDDWVEPDAYEAMYELARKTGADMVICDFYVNYANRQVYSSQQGAGVGADVAKSLLNGELHNAVWNKLMRSSIYRDNDLWPEPNVNMWEDVILSVRNAYFAKKIVHLPQACVHYNQENEGSYTAATLYSDKVVNDLLRVVSILDRFFEQRSDGSDYQKPLVFLKLSVKRVLLLHTKGVQRRSLQKLWPETTGYILWQKAVPIHYRIALWLANHSQMRASELLLSAILFAKKIR